MPGPSQLTLTNVQVTDEANYRVVVSNPYGSVTSSPPATLRLDAVAPTVEIRAPADNSRLFEETILLTGTAHDDVGLARESSGFFSLSVNRRGVYSAELQCARGRFPLEGQFALDGRSTNLVIRDVTNALFVEWTLDLAQPPTNRLTGRVFDGASAWVADLSGDLAPTYATNESSPYRASQRV